MIVADSSAQYVGLDEESEHPKQLGCRTDSTDRDHC